MGNQPSLLRDQPLNGATYVMDARRGAVPTELMNKPSEHAKIMHQTPAEAWQRWGATHPDQDLQAAMKRYAVPEPRLDGGHCLPPPNVETSQEKNARMHCIGNVAAQGAAGAAAASSVGAAGCAMFPPAAPAAGACAVIGGALGATSGFNNALQSDACKKTFKQ